MCLDFKVILRDVNRNDGVWSIRGDEPFEKNAVFLAKEWEPGLRGTGGEWRCVLISPASNNFALKRGGAFIKRSGLKLNDGEDLLNL